MRIDRLWFWLGRWSIATMPRQMQAPQHVLGASIAALPENLMLIDTRDARLPLTVGKLTRLVDACNTRLTCLRGQAWITIDGDRRDIVLVPGDQFVIDSNQPVLIYALNAGRPLVLDVDSSAPRCKPRRREGLAGWVQALRGLVGSHRPRGLATA
jgi:hypothetical protein